MDTLRLGPEFTQFAIAFESSRRGEILGQDGLVSEFCTVAQERLENEVQDGNEAGIERWDLEVKLWELIQRLYR
jgi:hypothetical protein